MLRISHVIGDLAHALEPNERIFRIAACRSRDGINHGQVCWAAPESARIQSEELIASGEMAGIVDAVDCASTRCLSTLSYE